MVHATVPRCIRGSHALLLAATVLVAGGCAVNDHGVARVQRFENDSAVLLRVTTFGAHLITFPNDAGLQLGYSDRTYVFPRHGGTARIRASVLRDPARWSAAGRLRPVEGRPSPHVDQPLLCAGRRIGVGFDANSDRIGLSLGFGDRVGLALPADGALTLWLRYRHGEDSETEVILQEETQ